MKTKLYIEWGSILLKLAPTQPLPDPAIFRNLKKNYQLLKAPDIPNK